MELESYYDRVKRNTAYEARMKGIELGRNEGIQQGLAEGRKQAKKELILGLLRENVPETIILDACYLTKEELEGIKLLCR